MKYIVTERRDTGQEEIFLFPRSVEHNHMAMILNHIKQGPMDNCQTIRRKPISAGFVNGHGECTGESLTLQLESRPQEDTALLAQQYS